MVCAVPFTVTALLADSPTATLDAFSDPANALFESMSGLTSTGLTVATDPRELPSSLQWWRSTTQWLGGVGILYIVLALTVSGRQKADPGQGDAAGDEANSDVESDDDVSIGSASRRTWLVYAILTFTTFLAMWLAGMPVWDAVNHAQTAVSTAGFSINADSLAGYERPAQAAALAGMIAGALSFFTLRRVVLKGKVPTLLRDRQAWLLVGTVFVGTLLLWPLSGLGGFDTLFQVATALCTAGFSTVAVGDLGWVTLVVLTVLMLVGASAGSTAGGLKLARVRRLVMSLWHREARDPALVEPLRKTRLIVLTFLLTFTAGVLALLVTSEASLIEAVFEAASAVGTVGLSTGLTDPDLPVGARLTLIVLMWLGRLEMAVCVALLLTLLRSRQPAGPA
jgi:trk system potassium uptake protein TrkH